jgi:hypothetical protein
VAATAAAAPPAESGAVESSADGADDTG